MSKIIKVGGHVLNFATLASVGITAKYVDWDFPVFNSNVEVNHGLRFEGEEADALRWYFESDRTGEGIYDVVEAYREHNGQEAHKREKLAKEIAEKWGWAGRQHRENYLVVTGEQGFTGTFEDWIIRWAEETAYYGDSVWGGLPGEMVQQYLTVIEKRLSGKNGDLLSFPDWTREQELKK